MKCMALLFSSIAAVLEIRLDLMHDSELPRVASKLKQKEIKELSGQFSRPSVREQER